MEFLAWPGVVLVLGTIAIFRFSQPLTRLLDRVRKIGKGGLTAGPSTQEAGSEVTPSPAAELLKTFDNALLVQREDYIRRELEQRKITQGPDRERVLIRHFAGVSLVLVFERIYSLIWGSQLAALGRLNSSGAAPLDTDLLRPFFDRSVAQNPEELGEDTFDRWLGFLQKADLVERVGERTAITLQGREFLKYLIHQGYELEKPA